MPPKLTVHNAEVRTATVEIKTLTVSGKQVTLAVFRQLRQEPLITDDGTLNGLPWGTVNYHPDPKACPTAAHWHTVWQDGAELRRSVDVKEYGGRSMWSEVGNQWLNSRVLDVVSGESGSLDEIPTRPTLSGQPEVAGIYKFKELDITVDLEASKHAAEAYFARRLLSELGDNEYAQHRVDDAIGRLREEVEKFGASTRQLRERYMADVSRMAGRQARLRQAHRQLADLPQIFIAV